MKTRLSLIVAQFNKHQAYDSDEYFKFLVDNSSNIPGVYLSTKDEKETLKELFEKFLNISYDWAEIKLLDFRKHMATECEVVYYCKLFNILNANKTGKFVSQNSNLPLDEYYEQLLAKRVRSRGHW